MVHRKLEEKEGLLDDSEDENGAPEAEDGDDFEQAVQKANRMASSIKKKATTQTKGKRKSSDNGEAEDDVVKRYGLDDYDEEELRKYIYFFSVYFDFEKRI